MKWTRKAHEAEIGFGQKNTTYTHIVLEAVQLSEMKRIDL